MKLNNALKIIRRSEKELNSRKFALEKLNKELMETNQALSILARNIDRDKELLEKNIYERTNTNIIPIIKKLESLLIPFPSQRKSSRYLYKDTNDYSEFVRFGYRDMKRGQVESAGKSRQIEVFNGIGLIGNIMEIAWSFYHGRFQGNLP